MCVRDMLLHALNHEQHAAAMCAWVCNAAQVLTCASKITSAMMPEFTGVFVASTPAKPHSVGGGAVRQMSSAVLEYVEMREHQVANRQCNAFQ